MSTQDILDIACHDGGKIVMRRLPRPGAPRLLLSHGNGFAIDGYRKFWELLAPDFELCLFDQRNHGRNPTGPVETHTLASMGHDQATVRTAVENAWGARTTIGLFHSVSSIASIRAAQEHATRWDALILFDPPLIAPSGNPLREMNEKLDATLAGFARNRPHHFENVEELAAQYRQRLGRTWVEGAAYDMAEATVRPAASGGFELCCPGEYEARIYADNAAYDSFDGVAALAQPTFFICADPDAPRALAPSRTGPQAAKAFGFSHVSVAGTGHLLQIEKPQEVARHTTDFIARFLAGEA